MEGGSAPAVGPVYTTLELGEGAVTYLVLDSKFLREERNIGLAIGIGCTTLLYGLMSVCHSQASSSGVSYFPPKCM